MDEEKKIKEKRSSFRGWKERNKGKMDRKKNIIIMIVVAAIFFGLAAYPYLIKNLNKIDDENYNNSINISKNTSIKQDNKTPSPTPKKTVSKSKTTTKTNTSSKTKKPVVGKIGVPLINSGLEITVKSVTLTDIRTSVWIVVRNKEDIEKQFKLGPGTVIIDHMGEQYESIKVTRSAQIVQTNLAAEAMREGAVFFDRFKEGRDPKRLILDINKQKVEFILTNSTEE